MLMGYVQKEWCKKIPSKKIHFFLAQSIAPDSVPSCLNQSPKKPLKATQINLFPLADFILRYGRILLDNTNFLDLGE